MIEHVTTNPHSYFFDEDVQRWAGGLVNDDFFNSISLEIARRYHGGLLNFEVCDSIMNDLWRIILRDIKAGARVPDPFFDIYLAFDAGEYHRTADKSDDPEFDFTRPMIADVLESELG